MAILLNCDVVNCVCLNCVWLNNEPLRALVLAHASIAAVATSLATASAGSFIRPLPEGQERAGAKRRNRALHKDSRAGAIRGPALGPALYGQRQRYLIVMFGC